MSDAQLLAHLAAERAHVLRAVDGLTEQQMNTSLVPSGWTMTRLLNHLAFDDEMFWISAVLGANPAAIEALHDGWHSVPMTGAEAVSIYREQVTSSDTVLAEVDLDAPPHWWPPASEFGQPPMANGREVVFRVLTETSVHAGHLDIVREFIDGHQNLVVNQPPRPSGPDNHRKAHPMPDFAILIYADESLHALEAAEADLEENDQHAQDLQAAGTMSLAYALTPRASAISVRHDGTTAGPFVQADQFVAGFYVIQAPDLAAAIAIARLNPAVRTGTGGVEVRPVHSGGIITRIP